MKAPTRTQAAELLRDMAALEKNKADAVASGPLSARHRNAWLQLETIANCIAHDDWSKEE